MAKRRLGVALLLPAGLAGEVDGLRRALGDPGLGRIPAHLTLVSPINVRDDRLHEALSVLRAAAAATTPFTLELGPPATFLPVNPVVYLAVGGQPAEFAALVALRDRVSVGALSRTPTRAWVPHVTLADEAPPLRIAAAIAALGCYRVTVELHRVHLLQEGPGRVWEPVADATFARPAVIGRGGLELELSVSRGLDPQAAALVGERRAALPGTPFAVTARREGRVVGVASGGTLGREAELGELVVDAAERGRGIGSHLLAAVESLAAQQGCSGLSVPTPRDERAAGFLRGRGWRDTGPPGRLRRDV